MQESIKLRCLQEYKLTNGDFGGNHGDLIAQFQGRNILLLINLSKKLLDVHTRAVGCVTLNVQNVKCIAGVPRMLCGSMSGKRSMLW